MMNQEIIALLKGEEARIILDPVPDYVIPATVSFVAADAEFAPKWVELTNERTRLMFRIKLKINPQLLEGFSSRMKTGVLGLGFVRTDPSVQWPEDLRVKLPKPPEAEATDTKRTEDSTPGAPASNGTKAAAPQGEASDNKIPEAKTLNAK
jgi:HlyD family secretion protein